MFRIIVSKLILLLFVLIHILSGYIDDGISISHVWMHMSGSDRYTPYAIVSELTEIFVADNCFGYYWFRMCGSDFTLCFLFAFWICVT